MTLTIAIPTYDRPQALAQTVARILPQLTEETELLIIDNASPTPAKDVTDVGSNPRVRLLRNRLNVGAVANVLRCFEEAKSPWIWVLGDDDDPQPDAVRHVLDAIRDHPEAMLVNFNSVHGAGPQDFSTRGRTELIERMPAFGNLLFISTNVYRTTPMLEHLHMAYRFSYAMAPHIVMLLLCTGKDGEAVFSDNILVHTDTKLDSSHWSAINQALSIPTLLELPLTPSERRVLAGKLELPDLPNQLIQLLGTGVQRAEFETSSFYFRQISGRLWPFTPLRKKLLIVLARTAFIFPGVALSAVNYVLRRKKGSSVMERMRAGVDDPRI